MMAQQPIPAFRSEALEQMKQEVSVPAEPDVHGTRAAIAREEQIREINPVAACLYNFMRDEEMKTYFEDGAIYDENDGVSLLITALPTGSSSFEDALTIEGSFIGEDGVQSTDFAIYHMTWGGALFRADYDNVDESGNPSWRKVSLVAQKDAKRVEEFKHMLGALVEAGQQRASATKESAERRLSLAKSNLSELERKEMGSDMGDHIYDFEQLDHILMQTVKKVLDARSRRGMPSTAVNISKARKSYGATLKKYGIDIEDEDQVRSLYGATQDIISRRNKASSSVREAEDELYRVSEATEIIERYTAGAQEWTPSFLAEQRTQQKERERLLNLP